MASPGGGAMGGGGQMAQSPYGGGGGPPAGASPYGGARGFSQAPQGADRNIAAQYGAGRGVTARYGPRPASPDDVAQRGTPEWRQAFNKQRDWMEKQSFSGATLADMGFRDEKDYGKAAYSALKAGDLNVGYRRDWAAAGDIQQRGYFDPMTGQTVYTRAAGGPEAAARSRAVEQQMGRGGGGMPGQFPQQQQGGFQQQGAGGLLPGTDVQGAYGAQGQQLVQALMQLLGGQAGGYRG